MGIRQFKPVTPATRFRSVSDFGEITKTTPEKSLLEPKRGTGGRNNKGHITSRYRGGGHKRQYRRIDFRREKFGDRKSTRLNSSHITISYAVFCLKKKKK